MIDKYALCSLEVPEVLQPGDKVKTAGAQPAVQTILDSLERDPKYTYALCNAMGDSWFYGSNSNADWYGYNPHLDFNGLTHAWSGIGTDVEADRLQAKDWPYGYPCFYQATVYAHHRNHDPVNLGFGDVQFAYYNPVMKRVELLMRIFNEVANQKGHGSLLQRIHENQRCDVSMGARVPFDLAECCTDWEAVKSAWATYDPRKHKHPGVAILAYHRGVRPIRGLAVTRNDYCSCFRAARNRVMPDGAKRFVYNDFPRFFDISIVHVGADRTAKVYWFLGASKTYGPSINLGGLLDTLLDQKVASMDKSIEGAVATVIGDEATTPEIDFTAILGDNTKPSGIKELLSTAAALGILLTPGEFASLVLPALSSKERVAAKVKTFDPGHGGVDDTYKVGPEHLRSGLLVALRALAEERSSYAPFLEKRARPTSKLAVGARPRTPGGEKIASLYNGYRISVLEQAGDLAAKGFEGVPGEKQAQNGLAGLLLGVAPLVHLVSAHLRRERDDGKQLGTMASFLADHPTFLSLATLGAAIRLVMLQEGGGLLGAAAKVLQARK